MNKLKALMVLALAFVVSTPAFAETQNVKVSGSIDGYGFYRDNYDLNNDGGSVSSGDSEADAYFMSQTQVEISADLTDNVSTVINILNERNWDGPSSVSGGASTQFDLGIDLAYVQMKEIWYAPLTLTIGRQDIWLGRGFVIGNNNKAWDLEGNLTADEYSASTAFDAIRATLDFNPWTIDLAYSKVSEGGNFNDEDDLDLYIANVNYKFAEYNAVAEGYFISEWDKANFTFSGVEKSSDTETIGARFQFDPISQITLGAEVAYQYGNFQSTVSSELDRSAWGVDVFGTYRWDNQWKPELTLEYVHFSGDSDSTDGDQEAWNGLYRGKFYTAYADFREFTFTTDQSDDTAATTNQNLFQIKGALKPMEDLLLEAAFSYIWADEEFATSGDDEIGWEVDLQATYDYTEDVSFGILAAWFVPGDAFTSPNDETATDLVGSVKVTF